MSDKHNKKLSTFKAHLRQFTSLSPVVQNVPEKQRKNVTLKICEQWFTILWNKTNKTVKFKVKWLKYARIGTDVNKSQVFYALFLKHIHAGCVYCIANFCLLDLHQISVFLKFVVYAFFLIHNKVLLHNEIFPLRETLQTKFFLFKIIQYCSHL